MGRACAEQIEVGSFPRSPVDHQRDWRGERIAAGWVDGRAIGSLLTVLLSAVSGIRLIAADVPALLQ
jgi:hypothetical protein